MAYPKVQLILSRQGEVIYKSPPKESYLVPREGETIRTALVDDGKLQRPVEYRVNRVVYDLEEAYKMIALVYAEAFTS